MSIQGLGDYVVRHSLITLRPARNLFSLLTLVSLEQKASGLRSFSSPRPARAPFRMMNEEKASSRTATRQNAAGDKDRQQQQRVRRHKARNASGRKSATKTQVTRLFSSLTNPTRALAHIVARIT